MKKTFLLSICLLFSSFIYSQDVPEWTYLGDTNSGTEIYMRIESSYSDTRQAWIKMLSPTVTKKNKQGKLIKIAGGSSISLWKVHCTDKTYSITNRIIYNNKGEVISEGNEYNEPDNERIIPDTLGEIIFTHICN